MYTFLCLTLHQSIVCFHEKKKVGKGENVFLWLLNVGIALLRVNPLPHNPDF